MSLLQSHHLQGWRLWLVTLAYTFFHHDVTVPLPRKVMLATFLVNIEVSIVSTSLITIANNLGSFDRTSWIVTGYLVTYTGRLGSTMCRALN